jgi:hypothetical protein
VTPRKKKEVYIYRKKDKIRHQVKRKRTVSASAAKTLTSRVHSSQGSQGSQGKVRENRKCQGNQGKVMENENLSGKNIL